jgi:hypothetical protein
VPTSSGAELWLWLTSKKYRGIRFPAVLAYDKAAKPFWFIKQSAGWFLVGYRTLPCDCAEPRNDRCLNHGLRTLQTKATDETTVAPEVCPDIAASGGDDPDRLGIAVRLDFANMDNAAIAVSSDGPVGTRSLRIALWSGTIG